MAKTKTKKQYSKSPPPKTEISSKEELLWEGPFEEEEGPTHSHLVWECKAHKYRVVRAISSHNDGYSGFAALIFNGKYWDGLIWEVKGSTYIKYFRSLEACLVAISEKHKEKHKLESLISNQSEVLEQAKSQKHHNLSGEIEEAPSTTSKTGGIATQRKPKKPSGGTLGKDEFGSKIGSNRALLHEQLTKELQTIEQMVKSAQLKYSSFKEHMDELVKQGLIRKEGNSYALLK